MRDHTVGRPALKSRGFTLAEMLMAMVMFGVLGIAATNFMIRQGAAVARTTEVASAQQGVRASLDRIANDIRIVGQGLNFYDIQIPDMIVPNDGTVGVNTFQSNAVSLIAIPDRTNPSTQLALSPAVVGNGNVGDTQITVDSTANLSGLATGERLILFDPNTGNSQVVAITSLTSQVIQFASDPLVYQFAATGTAPAIAIKLNEVRYRVRTVSGMPFLQRKVNTGPWVRFIEGITMLNFTYFDGTGTQFTPTTQAGRRAIQRVAIEVEGIQLRLGSANERRAHVKLTTSAVPRNMLP